MNKFRRSQEPGRGKLDSKKREHHISNNEPRFAGAVRKYGPHVPLQFPSPAFADRGFLLPMSRRAPYSELLRDPRWQKKRLKILEYADWRCQICGVSDRTLHCHHSYYRKGKLPWQYPDGSIIAVCDDCHENKIHRKKPREEFVPDPVRETPQEPPISTEKAAASFEDIRKMLSSLP